LNRVINGRRFNLLNKQNLQK